MAKWEKQKEYDKKKKVIFSVGLMRVSDKDIIDYLDNEKKKGKPRNAVIKEALREKIEKSSI